MEIAFDYSGFTVKSDMMKKITAVGLCLLLLSPILSATGYDEILASAMERSYTMKNAELTHQNNLLQQQSNDLEDEPVWDVTVSATPFSSNDITKDGFRLTGLTTSVTLPNDGNTKISISSPLSVGYGQGAFTISPTASVSHKFDFNAFDDDMLDDLNSSYNHLSTEKSYMEARYSFAKSVVQMLSQIVGLEKNIRSLEYQVEKADKDLSDQIALRLTNENSITYQRACLDLERNRSTLATYRDQLESAKKQFETSTGLVWDGVDDIPEPELLLESFEQGNTGVMIAGLDASIASQKVEQQEKLMNPSALTLSGAAGFDYYNDAAQKTGVASMLDKNAENRIKADVGVTYSGRNWSVGATLGASTHPLNVNITPSLTITGSWTSDNSSEKDRLELERLRNEAIKANNSYLDSLTNYNINAMSLSNSIMSYQFEYRQMEDDIEYYQAALDFEKALFEKGLNTQQDVDDAAFNLELAGYDRTITLLKGMELEYELTIFSL